MDSEAAIYARPQGLVVSYDLVIPRKRYHIRHRLGQGAESSAFFNDVQQFGDEDILNSFLALAVGGGGAPAPRHALLQVR